jgi:hypothetical protein
MMKIMASIWLSKWFRYVKELALANAVCRGFQSIGAYHAPSSNGIAVSGALKSR